MSFSGRLGASVTTFCKLRSTYSDVQAMGSERFRVGFRPQHAKAQKSFAGRTLQALGKFPAHDNLLNVVDPPRIVRGGAIEIG